VPERAISRLDALLERAGTVRVAVAVATFALAVYLASNPGRSNVYAHYAWQADAWLHGRFDIAWPVADGPVRNDYYHDVLPVPGRPGRGQIPYPPLPAVVLLPFVAAAGPGADAELVAAFIGALNAALAWLLARRLATRPSTALAATVFFAFGTVAWVAAARGSTWYLAHDLAITFTLLAILATLARRRGRAGILMGMAVLARLTAAFGASFLFLADRRAALRTWLLAAGGLALPIAGLLAYDLASTGQLIQPSYEQLYRTEQPAIETLHHPDWAILDPRYVPQNLAIMLLEPPRVGSACGVLPVARECPDEAKAQTLMPDPLGMSLLLVSPGWLLGLAALRRPRSDVAVAAVVTVAAIALVDLMHFSQGWVQFGYRFSNDWAPFGLVLVTLGLERLGLRRGTVALIAVSVLVNLWGVYWAEVLGW
jgi:hypothetical protein